MTTSIVVVGAGGFGREVLDVLEAINAAEANAPFDVLGVLDDAPSAENALRLKARDVLHLGGVQPWLLSGNPADYVIAVGSPTRRRTLAQLFDRYALTSPTLVHPQAVIGSQVVLGTGTVVCAGAQIATNVWTGRHVHLNANVTIGHDTVLADYVSVNPAATVSGECLVAECVLLGAASVVLQGLTIAAGSTVGAAACVVRNVQGGVVVKGVPAR